jgi:mannose-6-phosphate isomerase-like protein (cupin superfamily)
MIDSADVILKRFDEPDELREMTLGRFELITLGGRTIGRATYQPGWRWSQHVGGGVAGSDSRCGVEHVGLVISGRAAVLMDDGEERVMEPGQLFHVAPGHDSWVVGDEPYVSLHFLGAGDYAA